MLTVCTFLGRRVVGKILKPEEGIEPKKFLSLSKNVLPLTNYNWLYYWWCLFVYQVSSFYFYELILLQITSLIPIMSLSIDFSDMFKKASMPFSDKGNDENRVSLYSCSISSTMENQESDDSIAWVIKNLNDMNYYVDDSDLSSNVTKIFQGILYEVNSNLFIDCIQIYHFNSNNHYPIEIPFDAEEQLPRQRL